MRKALLFLSFILCQLLAFAQAPQGLNYQAIYRDDKGVAVANQSVSVVFSILENSITGASVYTEKHTAQTNAFGLFNLVIGKGAPQTGTFANIDWSNGSKFLKVEVNNTLIGTTQLMSAPYALYAENGSQKLSIKDKTITLSKNGGSINIPKDSTNVRVSKQGDTLWIDNTYVIIKGVSAVNGGGQEADAGQDVFLCAGQSNTYGCYLDANIPLENATGVWTILSGKGGVLSNPYSSKSIFQGNIEENYILKWTITKNGFVNEDLVNIRFEKEEYLIPFAGFDTILVNSNKTTLNAIFTNSAKEKGKWSIESGTGGVFSDIANPNSIFEGILGEIYLLKWTVYNPSAVCQNMREDFVKIIFSNNKLSNNGSYYIPDLRFRRILQVLHPAAMVGDSLKINEVSKIIRLDLSNYGIINFDGLQYLAALKYLNCSGNNSYIQNRINLPEPLPSNLDTLICRGLGLKKLPKLPSNLKYLDCASNNYYSLVELPNSMEYLNCSYNNNIKTLPKLPINLKYLYCDLIENLEELPVLPPSLLWLFCQANIWYERAVYKIKKIPDLPSNLKILNLYGQANLLELPLLPNSLLQLNISYTNISTLLKVPLSLEYLFIESTKIEKLPFLPNSLKYVNLSYFNESKIICITNIPSSLELGNKNQLALYPICP